MTEISKYRCIYSRPAQFHEYGHSNHGAKAVGIIERWKPDSLLDVGCGFNEFVKGIRETMPELRAMGVDFACPGADRIAEAKSLPFTDKEFDVLTAFDVLEHIAPEDVDCVIEEFARVSKRFILSISHAPSKNTWRGENLHPTVRSEKWWIKRLAIAGAIKIAKRGRFITGEWFNRLRIPTDASVILVGNGPSILAAENGAVIDSFDEVIRFNNVHIAGYEKHTGSKTTLWAARFRGLVTEVHCNRVLSVLENTTFPDACTETYRIPMVFYQRMKSDVQRRAQWMSGLNREVDHLEATSGLMVAAWLIEMMGVKQVALVGFDHFKKDKSRLHHYWINKTTTRPKEHDGDVEAEMFSELAKAGRIRYI